TKNPAFIAGQTFHVRRDKTHDNANDSGRPSGDNYLITQLSFVAYESAYGHYWYQDAVNWVDSPVRWIWGMFRKKNLKKGVYLDATGALASGGLANWVQNQNITHFTPQAPASPFAPANPAPMNFGDTFFAGMNTSLVQAMVQLAVVNNIKDIIARHDDDYANAFIAVPWDNAKYKLVPGPDATRPRANGPHLAIVVGRDGIGGDTEIYADALGRVRVRFPWQREVPLPKGLANAPDIDLTDPKNSDRRTCWVPVSEGWAGRDFGTQFLPRIGQEVIVSFIDGDPERPIITGRVYSADTGVSNLPFPNSPKAEIKQITDLPFTADTYPVPLSGIKTRSSTKPADTTKGYHLLRFDDTSGNEQLLLRSQGRMDTTAKASHFDTTIGDRHLLCIAGLDKTGTKTVQGSMFITTGKPHFGTPPNGNYDLHIGGSRYEQVDGVDGYQLTVKKDTQLNLQQNCTAVVGGVLSLGASSIVLEAAQKITLKVGSNTIVINAAGVHIDGLQVPKQAGGPADEAAAVTMKDVLDAIAADPGEPANARSGGGGGGGNRQRGETIVFPPQSLDTSLDEDDMLSVPV
ncbi:MAG TPA: phage baseplate assembly protein V, partial [Acetobacteraceae bacterium]|nr:phage baseplate assembly protein V [Acetobacteraceae bacterium]